MAVIYITAGSTWTVPADWDSAANTIEAIGAGGNGSTGVAGSTPGGGVRGGETGLEVAAAHMLRSWHAERMAALMLDGNCP